ncbi:hypothetical protein AS96_07710 [Microbacterium sp. MRS-1]|nr:hypothetical protein [Microbacterium sp. MRS-1]EXJ51816.1 hypothetical protein AS96_07710 [Microbacterium sp. MRS-1]MBN9151224.1 hypothetical protein [Micrococcales bacterium]
MAQLGDGLVALPRDARTQEQLEWVAEQVHEAEGSATLWVAAATSARQERDLIGELVQARTAEYAALIARAVELETANDVPVREVRSLRRELREVERRDFFPPVEREQARRAAQRLAVRAGLVQERVR